MRRYNVSKKNQSDETSHHQSTTKRRRVKQGAISRFSLSFHRVFYAIIVMILMVKIILYESQVMDTRNATDSMQTQDTEEATADLFSRVYPKNNRDWCQNKNTTNNNNSLLFIKLTKCASSTGAGITLNIAENHAHHHLNSTTTTSCFRTTSVRHGETQRLPLLSRNRQQSILWTILRHPAERALSSYFFFQVSRQGDLPNDDDILEYCNENKNLMLDMLTEGSLSNLTTIRQVVQEVDFMAISERMEESLVVFRLLFGLPPEDVIVLPSKRTGEYDDGRSGFGCCKIRSKTAVSPTVDEYLTTSFVDNNNDYALYAAANASLDRTIDALGRAYVARQVKRHVYLQQLAERKCLAKAVFPCSNEGKQQFQASKKSCLENDWACGHECVRQVLRSS